MEERKTLQDATGEELTELIANLFTKRDQAVDAIQNVLAEVARRKETPNILKEEKEE